MPIWWKVNKDLYASALVNLYSYAFYKLFLRGDWVAHLVKQLALDFRSGHDLRVLG